MSSAAYALAAVVWLSLVALAVVVVLQRSPRRRKPVDELEAADAALRNRLVDLEDKFEHYTKREAVRAGRAKREDMVEQPVLPLADRAAHLSMLRQKVANLVGGRGRNGTTQ